MVALERCDQYRRFAEVCIELARRQNYRCLCKRDKLGRVLACFRSHWPDLISPARRNPEINETQSFFARCRPAKSREDPTMWFEIWVVTIALAIGCVVMAQIIERQGDAVRGS
jgi:hypothetical protein